MSGLRGVCNQCFTFVSLEILTTKYILCFSCFFFLCRIFIYTSSPLLPFHFPLISSILISASFPTWFDDNWFDHISFVSFETREREKRNLKEKNIYIKRILAPVKTSHDFKLNLSFFGTSYSSKWFPRRENFDNFARRDSAKNKREGGKRGGGRRKKEWAEWTPWQRLISTGNGSIASTFREEWVRVTFQ